MQNSTTEEFIVAPDVRRSENNLGAHKPIDNFLARIERPAQAQSLQSGTKLPLQKSNCQGERNCPLLVIRASRL